MAKSRKRPDTSVDSPRNRYVIHGGMLNGYRVFDTVEEVYLTSYTLGMWEAIHLRDSHNNSTVI